MLSRIDDPFPGVPPGIFQLIFPFKAMSASSVTEECNLHEHNKANSIGLKREPWNKGKLIGAKPPLHAKHV